MDPSLPKPTQAVLVYQFSFPKTKKVNLASVFRTDDGATKENLNKTTAIRDEVVAAIDGGNSSSIVNVSPIYKQTN